MVEDGRNQVCSRAVRQDLPQLDGECPRLVYLPSALVGPSDSRLGTVEDCGEYDRDPGGSHRSAATAEVSISSGRRTCWTPGSPRRCGPLRLWAGRTRLRISTISIPPDVLVTGYDIIFFWVARMIFSGCEHIGEDALPHGADPRPCPGRQGPEDVQVSGQRH